MKRPFCILALLSVVASFVMIGAVRSQDSVCQATTLAGRIRTFAHTLLDFDPSGNEIERMYLLTRDQFEFLQVQMNRAEQDSELRSRPYSELSEEEKRLANLRGLYLAEISSVGSDYVEIEFDTSTEHDMHLIPIHKINHIVIAEKPYGFDATDHR